MKKYGVHFVDKHGIQSYDDVWVTNGIDPIDQFEADYGDDYARITQVVFLWEDSETHAAVRKQKTRKLLSEQFNRGAQTIDEATTSARAMALSMEQLGQLQKSGKKS